LSFLLLTNLIALGVIIILFLCGLFIEKIIFKSQAIFTTKKITYSALSCAFYITLNVVIIWLGKLIFFSLITIQIAQSFFLIFGFFFGISLGIVIAMISDLICFLLTSNFFGYHFGFSLDLVLFAFFGGVLKLFDFKKEKNIKILLIIFDVFLVLLIKLCLDRFYLSALLKINMFNLFLMINEVIITVIELPFYLFFLYLIFDIFKLRFNLNLKNLSIKQKNKLNNNNVYLKNEFK